MSGDGWVDPESAVRTAAMRRSREAERNPKQGPNRRQPAIEDNLNTRTQPEHNINTTHKSAIESRSGNKEARENPWMGVVHVINHALGNMNDARTKERKPAQVSGQPLLEP
jgi:hypothetical protein